MAHQLERIGYRLASSEKAWVAVTSLAVVGGAAAGRALLKGGWRATTGTEPPINPESEENTWMQSIAWALLTGAVVGLVRTLIRKSATTFRKSWV